MDILSEVYFKSAAENEKNFRFWENYLQSLQSLDFSIYGDKLKVPALIPIGSRISFRGELKHTNEVTVALGADYFVKCSVQQAEVLRQHRIKDAQSKVSMFNKEKEYLENQMSFTQKAIYDNQGKEIIEDYNEEDDKAWRQAHREKVRQYKQNKGKEEKDQTEVVPDEVLWNRLEELELQEELENELSNEQDDNIDNKHLTKRKATIQEYLFDELEDYIKVKNDEVENEKTNPKKSNKEKKKKATFKETTTPEQTSKLDKLQQVIDKQNDLEEKLFQLKIDNRERSQTKTEKDLISRLDELEQLAEVEDEMDRLDDIIENEDIEEEEEEQDTNETQTPKLERRVSFVDEDDSNTLEITFKHSPTQSNNEPYNPKKGIQKPSDIYVAHSKLFANGTTSILKKSKHEAMTVNSDTKASEERVLQDDTQKQTPSDIYDADANFFGNCPKSILKKSTKYGTVTEKTDAKPSQDRLVQFGGHDNTEPEIIVIKDVVEKEIRADLKLISKARPTSLFKKKRMLNKSNKI